MSTKQEIANLTPDDTLAQIASVDNKAGELLASIGLEPSHHKNETLRSVCQERQWSGVEVLQWVKKNRITCNGHIEDENPHERPDFGKDIY